MRKKKHLLEWLKLERLIILSANKNVQELELSHSAVGNIRWDNHFGNHFKVF